MIHNDVLRSVRYLLDLHETQVLNIIKLAKPDTTADTDAINAYLKKEDEEGYLMCPINVFAAFLDGLVYHRRGQDESRPHQATVPPISNNLVLKKLRVAFELKDSDMLEIMQSVGITVTKTELSALFRAQGHNNYRNCGDQWLRNFLKGLTLRVRGKAD